MVRPCVSPSLCYCSSSSSAAYHVPDGFRQQRGRPGHVRDPRPRVPATFCKIASWSVEGLGISGNSAKLEHTMNIMRERDIAIVCLQETHIPAATYFICDGFLLILSEGPEGAARICWCGFSHISLGPARYHGIHPVQQPIGQCENQSSWRLYRNKFGLRSSVWRRIQRAARLLQQFTLFDYEHQRARAHLHLW